MTWKDARERLIDAMVKAEGGPHAFIRAVQCSIPSCQTYAEAREIAQNTISHALWDYVMTGPLPAIEHVDQFIAFLGSRWAPVGAANDPTNLNANWTRNVQAFYHHA